MTGSKQENNKWPQYLVALTAAQAIFAGGIYLGWPSPSIPKMLSDEYALDLTNEEVSYISLIGAGGLVIGMVALALVGDSIGRKTILLMLPIPQILCMLMISFGRYSVVLLYVGRTIGGLAEGIVVTALPLYICEISEPKYRGNLASISKFIMYSGSLFMNILGSECSIELTSFITLASPLLFLVTFPFMPESPYYLLMKKRKEDCRNALKKLRGIDDVDKELCELASDIDRQMSERGKYQDILLIKSNRTACGILILVMLTGAFTGAPALGIYSQQFFMDATDVMPKEWASSLMVFLQIIFVVCSSLFIDFVGRRPLLLSSIAGCFLSDILLAVFFLLRDSSSLDLEDFQWVPLFGVILLNFFFCLGLDNVCYCLSGELLTASIKVKAACLLTIIGAIGVFSSTKLYQSLGDSYGFAVPLFIFSACQVIGFALCWRQVPETKRKTLEDIQQVLKAKL